jgi:Armadillo/beta-catenin-like repeat
LLRSDLTRSSFSFASAFRRQGHPCIVMDEYGEDSNDNNNNAGTSGRSSGGGDSSASDTNRELVDFHAFILGLVGNGAADDANPNRPGNRADARTPAGRGRSIRAMAEGNPEMKQLLNIVVGVLKRRLKCVTFFRQLISRSTTEEKASRVASREDPSIQAVVYSGAVRDLVAIIGGSDAEEDSENAAWALIHFVDAGTKWHIQQAIDMGVLPKFVVLLDSSNVEIRKETARVLGNMTSCGASRSWRDSLWDSGAIAALIMLLQQDDDVVVLRYAACVINNVCEDEPEEDRIGSVAPTLAQLLHFDDEEVLEKACFALSAIVDFDAPPGRAQMIIRMGVCRRLVELLKHQSRNVKVYVEEDFWFGFFATPSPPTTSRT